VTYNQAIEDVLMLLNSQIPQKKRSTYLILKKIRSLKKSIEQQNYIEECVVAWSECLVHFKIERKVTPRDKLALSRALERIDKDDVILALLGAQYEPPFDGFDPGLYLSLARIFDPSKIDRFINLGAKALTKRKRLAAIRPAPKVEEQEYVDPAEFRKVMAAFK